MNIEDASPIPKLTEKQWEKLDSNLRKALGKTGQAFALWLFNNKNAKNYVKLSFGNKGSDEGFDLVLRKWGSDSNVICPFCSKTHNSPE